MAIRRKRIENEAVEILERFAVKNPAVPVEAIARYMGLTIRHQPLESDISGFLFQKDGTAIIGVNSNQAKVRQRFTIAHELAHFVLHQSTEIHVDRGFRVQFRLDQAASNDPDEVEANLFAAELLMPRHFIDRDVRILQMLDILDEDAISELAKKYDVSSQAFLIRLMSLGYVQS